MYISIVIHSYPYFSMLCTYPKLGAVIKVAKKSKRENKQHILLSVKRGDISVAITLNIELFANKEK